MNPSVTDLVSQANHPLTVLIQELRQLILKSQPGLVENTKWNAPNYALNGQDLITFNYRKPTEVQVVFHRGAKPDPSFKFEDKSGLLKMASADRGILTLKSEAELTEVEQLLAKLVQDWCTA
jgi:hypothetical protein